MAAGQPIINRSLSTATILAATLLASPLSDAQQPEEEVVVIGVTPTQEAGLPESQIPYHVQSAGGEDIERSQSLDLTDFLNRNIGSISLNDVQNNPLQPDLQYRGFTASPLLGLSQGIAVYQNGIRINEPLGDAVNWDLLPESAIHSINLIGGADPLFGLNSLGGSLSIHMKDGFNSAGHHLKAYGGSFERKVAALESGGNNGSFGYYANVHYFDEDGWRELSKSDALNFYGSIGWRGRLAKLNLNLQYGDSELFGNGPLPVELMAQDRKTIFTAPDITENRLFMVSMDGSHALTSHIDFSGNAFYRKNNTDSFNGDSSEFVECALGAGAFLIEGVDEDDLADLGLNEADVCENNVLGAADPGALETTLNALVAPGANGFNIQDLTGELSGTGILADAAINNTSKRSQQSYGTDLQFTLHQDLFRRSNQLILGAAYFKGETEFTSRLELADLDPITRSTTGLGTGAFLDEAATDIETKTETFSFYFMDTIALTDELSLTLSGRLNNTAVTLADQSGERPELNGEHDFFRFNPAAGFTYQMTEHINLYGGYSESSRAPTPIELACNNRIFDLAVANAIAAGEDPADVDFECRLPNAFLADPPLEQVVAKSFEFGARGEFNQLSYHLGFFHTVNHDDIIFQTTGRSTGLFANVDKTRRLGFESSVNGLWGSLEWFLAYSYIEATFEDNFSVLSPNHPFADDAGEVLVASGDRIPGIPEHQFKLGGDYYFTEDLSFGLDVIYNSDQVLRGDESNQLPTVDGYALLNLRTRYRYNQHMEFFAKVSNLLDTDYETFGLLGEDPSEVDTPLYQNFSIPRFLGPGAPRAVFAGIKLSL